MTNNTYLKRTLAVVATAAVIFLAITLPASATSDDAAPNKPTMEAERLAAEKARVDAYWKRVVEFDRQYRIQQFWRQLVEFDRQWRIRQFAKAYQAHLDREAAKARRSGGRVIDGIEVCNGTTLPTCRIVQRESGFNPRAKNPRSTASGLYQFINGTWRTCGTGYPTAMSAPVRVQVECARKIWANGRGASHWRLTL